MPIWFTEAQTVLVSLERLSCGLFRSRGPFTHNMQTSSAWTLTVVTYHDPKWTFIKRKHIRTNTILFTNGPISKRASGPFSEASANVFPPFLHASVSRLFLRGPFFLHLESGGRKGYYGPPSEKMRGHGPGPGPPPQWRRLCIGPRQGSWSEPTHDGRLWSRHLTFFSYFIIK